MKTFIAIFVLITISYSPGEAISCTDVPDPCKLVGTDFESVPGYSCTQTDANNVMCKCPSGDTSNEPCRRCARKDSASNICKGGVNPLLFCLDSADLGSDYVCLCENQGNGEAVQTLNPTCDLTDTGTTTSAGTTLPPGVTTTSAGSTLPPGVTTTSAGSTLPPGVTTSAGSTAPPGNCQNRGVFANGVCNCPSGFSGQSCETYNPPGLCDRIQCKNGGACAIQPVNGIYQSRCLCKAGFGGPYCEQTGTAGYCSANFCQNNGACREVAIGASRYAYCDCPPGVSGTKCENKYFTCSSAGLFPDSVMGEQGYYFECIPKGGGLQIQKVECPKGLRFNSSLKLCTL